VLDRLLGKTVACRAEDRRGGQAYLRESILNPSAKITNGYQPIMPTFQGWSARNSCSS
jgi:hypothetical protein